MGFSYNKEAKPGLVAARDDLEQSLVKWGSEKEELRDLAKRFNSQKIIDATEVACQNMDAAIALFKEMLGEPGDKVSSGIATIESAINACDVFAEI